MAGRAQTRRGSCRVAAAACVSLALSASAASITGTAAQADPSARSATSTWTALTLQNGWTNSPFGTSAAALRTVSGIVHFKGAIATTHTNPVPFTLPPSFRPSAVVFVTVGLCNATNGRLQIEPSGVVTVEAEGGAFSNAACFTSLDGASFGL